MKYLILILFLLFTFFLISKPVYSHTTSTSYLNLDLNKTSITGTWQVTVKDIHLVLGLDINNDSKLIWSEIINQKYRILEELNKSIKISSNSNICRIHTRKIKIDRRSTNVFLIIPFETNCHLKSRLLVNYNFLFDIDAFHKTILTVKDINRNSTTILSYSNRTYQFDAQSANSFQNFLKFITQGIIHVLIGLDHVLFVICLLLSATLFMKNSAQQENNSRFLMTNIFKLITTFTVAHSITLILASTKILSISPIIIEPAIALSVIVLALLNLNTHFNFKHWPIVFLFGLIHGFGFAFVLEEVQIQSSSLISSLFGFNLGVEIGQFVIVLSVLPLLYILITKKFYSRYVVPISSVLIAVTGLVWFIDRTSNLI